jgi:hypothetical protein
MQHIYAVCDAFFYLPATPAAEDLSSIPQHIQDITDL